MTRITYGVLLALWALMLGGCQPAALDDLMQGRKIEYNDPSSQRGKRLDHPPDIISDALTAEGEGGDDAEGGDDDGLDGGGLDDGVSLSDYRVGDVPEIPETGTVSPDVESAEVELKGGGNLLWLEAKMTPEQAWETALGFWQNRMGFPLETEEQKLGYMETEWLDLRIVRGFGLAGLLDDFLGRLRDSGQRDKFRTRIDAAEDRQSARIYIAHRHLAEIYDLRREGVRAGLQAMPPDPHLEAEMLRRMLLYFAGEDVEPEQPEGEDADAVAALEDGEDADADSESESDSESDSESESESEEVEDAPVELGEDYELREDSLLIRKSLRDAYLLVRIGLDRGGFTLEDRDISEGSFYIRHSGGPESDRIFGSSEEGFFNKFFVRADPVVRDIKIQLSSEGEEDGHTAARAESADDEGDLTEKQSLAILRLLAENLP